MAPWAELPVFWQYALVPTLFVGGVASMWIKSKVCKENFCSGHIGLVTLSTENNAMLKEIKSQSEASRSIARDERQKLFNIVGEIKDDLSEVKTKIAIIETVNH